MDWDIVDLGTLAYAPALERQRRRNLAVSLGEARAALLLVEHEPVITISHRKGVRDHLLVPPGELERLGIDVRDTDRGGDITYHGPGQLVAYPIVRLQDHGLNLGRYMRLLERAVIDTAAAFGVTAHPEPGATGVWVGQELGVGGWELGKAKPEASDQDRDLPNPQNTTPKTRTAKLCALGVRVRKNTTMHGLALNVTTDLSHFATIDPCGLGGRAVTSLTDLLGEDCPAMSVVKARLTRCLGDAFDAARDRDASAGASESPVA